MDSVKHPACTGQPYTAKDYLVPTPLVCFFCFILGGVCLGFFAAAMIIKNEKLPKFSRTLGANSMTS